MTYSRSSKNNRFFIFLLVLVLAGVLFAARPLIISALYPFQLATASVWKAGVNIPASIINLKNLAAENSELKKKIDLLQPQAALDEELKLENDRLRSALGFKSANRYGSNLLPAQVVARGAAPLNSILIINCGASVGVNKDRPVVSQSGLVGRVIEVSQFSAKVQLITDPLSSVAATDQRSRAYGVVEGNSSNNLSMKYTNASGDLQVGDKIITSPISSLFPAGLVIGTVVEAKKKDSDLFYEVRIKPAVDFSSLEEVFVIL